MYTIVYYSQFFIYSDTVWGGLSVDFSENLQRLQNRAAHIIERITTTKETFQMLGWVNLERQIKIAQV